MIQRPTGVLALVSFASALQQAIAVGLAFLLLPAPEPPSPVWAVVRAGACGVLGMAVYIAAGRWRRLLGDAPPRPDEPAPPGLGG